MRILDLRCEYRTDPLGLDVLQPRLSWKLEAEERAQFQTAYQAQASASREALLAGQADLWDTGKVESGKTTHVVYAGLPLTQRQRAWWRVQAWDKGGQPSGWSEPAFWELGLLSPDDWQAQWIGSTLAGGERTSTPVPYLRKNFTLPGPVQSARLYVTALGVYEFELNGQRVGADVLAPGWTVYTRRVAYQTYDVTALLQPGENAAGAILGDGWYCGNVAWRHRQNYGDRPRLLAQLEVSLADGSCTCLVSDETWQWATGPILESDLLMGESYDARRELTGWSQPGYQPAASGTRWLPVEVFPGPSGAVVAQMGPTVRRQEELQPVGQPRRMPGWPNPRWIYDLGQNMTGWVRLKVSGKAGTTVALRFAEVLNPDGSLYTANLRAARATDFYTLRGGGEEVWEPRFTFHGFRYVEVSGLAAEPGPGTILGIVLHSEMDSSGCFECSDPLLNQLQHNIQWGQKGNFLDVPTDCPQRDERLGWTGDAQVFVRTATFNRDVAGFFTRWVQTLADSQGEDGSIPPTAPNVDPLRNDGGPAWAEAFLIVPWTIYLAYGDTRLLADHYGEFQRFLGFLQATSRDHIRCYDGYDLDKMHFTGFGDWLSTNAETPKELIGTAFYAHSARLLSRIAGVLGKSADAARYEALFQEVRQAFQRRYVTPAGLVGGHTQTGYVLALHFDLLPEALRPAAVDALVWDIRKRKEHLSTGFVGTPYLLHVLTEAGQLDLAYQLLLQKSWPSWLYPVLHGATTIWERWDGWTEEKGFQDPGMNSFNHYAYGAVGDWLYATVAGLDWNPADPGYAQISVHPRPGGGLSWAKAEYNSLYGPVASDWERVGDIFTLRVVVPVGSTATVYVPTHDPAGVTEGCGMEAVTFLRAETGCAVYEIGSGEYLFRSTL